MRRFALVPQGGWLTASTGVPHPHPIASARLVMLLLLPLLLPMLLPHRVGKDEKSSMIQVYSRVQASTRLDSHFGPSTSQINEHCTA
jgi:hypothetical protein